MLDSELLGLYDIMMAILNQPPKSLDSFNEMMDFLRTNVLISEHMGF